MTADQFVIWLKGFTEACNDLTATPKQWDRIKEELDEVEDSPGVGIEIDDWKPSTNLFPPNGTHPNYLYRDQLSGTVYSQGGAITFTSGSSSTSITNFPPGTSITYTNNTKQQLND